MANIESKLDRVTNQMRSEIKQELEAGMVNVQKELEKMFVRLLSKVNRTATGKSTSGVIEPGSPVENQKSTTSSMAATTYGKEVTRRCLLSLT